MRNFRIHLSIKLFWIICLGSIFTACETQQRVFLSFQLNVDGQALEFGKSYPSPNGEGTYSINDFKLYVSNIKLLETGKTDNIYIEKDSYHLLRFPDGQPFSFYLDQVPDFPFDRIQLTIGIDQEANSSIETPGDLDPTNQMAWNWTSGYKFLLLEGLYTPGDMGEVIPLVYHIGFSENARQVEFDLQSGREIRFNIEINDLFRSPHPIDFHITPKVLFNEEDAAIIAMNYGEEFLLLQQTTTGQHKTQGRTGLKLN